MAIGLRPETTEVKDYKWLLRNDVTLYIYDEPGFETKKPGSI